MGRGVEGGMGRATYACCVWGVLNRWEARRVDRTGTKQCTHKKEKHRNEGARDGRCPYSLSIFLVSCVTQQQNTDTDNGRSILLRRCCFWIEACMRVLHASALMPACIRTNRSIRRAILQPLAIESAAFETARSIHRLIVGFKTPLPPSRNLMGLDT